jgi:hypothetical protein
MAADEKVLIEIEVDNDQAVKDINKQNEAIERLQQENKELAAQGKKNSKQYQQNAASIQKLNSSRRQNIKLVSAEKGSLNELRANLARLTTQRNAVNTSTKEGAAEFKRLNKQIKEQNDSIKEAEQSGGDFRRSVGDYKSALDGVIPSFQGLNAAMLASPIGLIVAGITALVYAFSKTEKGAKFLKTTLAVLNAVFDTLVGYVGQFAVSIVDAFENPVQSLQNFANLVQNYVLEKVNALIDMFGFLGDVIKNVFEGDFDAAVESAKKAGDSFLKANPYVDLFEATAEAAENVVEKVKENVVATIELEDATWKLQRSMLATQKEIAKLEGQEAVLASRAEDATLSFQEQEEAQQKLIDVQKQKFATQQSLISQEINLIQTQLDIAKRNGQDTLEIQRELTAKQIELTGVRNEARVSETENLKITRQRNQDIWEQELDFIIDVGEKEVEIYRKLAEDSSLSIEERKVALENYQTAYAQFLATQRKQFEEEGLSEDEFNRLLGIKDPEELAQAITDLENLSEVEKNRLREVFIEFKNAKIEEGEIAKTIEEDITKSVEAENKKREQSDKQAAENRMNLLNSVFNLAKQLAGKNEKLSKAIGITQAIINTATGITKAFATLPTPAAFGAAATIAATGGTQVATITSAGGTSSSPTAPNVNSGTTPNTTNIDNSIAEREALENAISNLGLTVSVTEINDVQNQVQVTQQTATI